MSSRTTGVLDGGWVRVRDARITGIGAQAPPGGVTGTVVDLDGHWVVPGFVDLRCHGGGGGSFSSPDLTESATAVAEHRRHSTTTLLASLVSAPGSGPSATS